mmetsp:Transcript_8069/g.8589  ORF Transcript_8069/g.8589 Transcript_8069/m.8589 type:complete len:309 (-) Transcript_8069:453-1379(-)
MSLSSSSSPPSSISTSSSLEVLLFDIGLFYKIFSYLNWYDLLNLESINTLFYQQVRVSEPVWREAASDLFKDKVYIHPLVRRLIHNGNKENNRNDLISLSVKQLKNLAYFYGLNITTCFEKRDLISVINKRELKSKLPVECLAHFAVRIAWIDRKRNCITEEDLSEVEWNIRVRGDGPLQTLISTDPWWTDEVNDSLPHQPTTTLAKFYKNGEFQLYSTGPSPLQSMLGTNLEEKFNYTLEKSGTVVSLSIGVREYVGRHPINWGFILQSQGTVWTNWIMPPRGKDPLLHDENVSQLLNRNIIYGPML